MISVIIYSAIVISGLVYRVKNGEGLSNSGEFDPWTDDWAR